MELVMTDKWLLYDWSLLHVWLYYRLHTTTTHTYSRLTRPHSRPHRAMQRPHTHIMDWLCHYVPLTHQAAGNLSREYTWT